MAIQQPAKCAASGHFEIPGANGGNADELLLLLGSKVRGRVKVVGWWAERDEGRRGELLGGEGADLRGTGMHQILNLFPG